MKKLVSILLASFFLMGIGITAHAQLLSVKVRLNPPVVERPPAPSEKHVWVDGEWVEQKGHYVWKKGYWTIPEPYKVYEKGYWAQKPNGQYHWVQGHWKMTDQHIAVRTRPKDIVETRPVAPSPRHVWIDGEWVWGNNNYTWKKGYWVVPEEHKKWDKGYWTQRPNGTWFWVAGRWIER